MKYRRLSVIAVVLMLCVVFVIPLSTAAYGADECEVIYEGQAEKFVFIPESTDLFRNFKNVYPGDSINQNIKISNGSKATVSVYLRAEAVDKEYCDFLDNFSLSITAADGRKISDETASQKGGLKNNVLIGTFSSGKSTFLNVGLNADRLMNNDFQNMTGKVRWIFSVVENENSVTPESSINITKIDKVSAPESNVPTGDSRRNMITAAIVTLTVSAFSGAAVITCKKRNKA